MIRTFFIKLHRILGSALSLVFLVWFLSGFVMIYSGFPHADRKRAFNKQEPLKRHIASVQPFTTDSILPQQLTLSVLNGKPVYTYSDKQVDASTLAPIHSFSEKTLDSIISVSYTANFEKEVLNDFDSWIPWAYFEKYFPIHKYYIKNSAKTEVYLSEKTGKIVQETTAKKRWLARFGAIPHWFYFKSLRLQKGLWADIIIWLSGIGCILCLSGIVVGFYRSRKWRKAKKRGLLGFSPYKKKWYRWHHIIGMTFGLFTFTFVFSGMLSLMSIPQWLVPVDTSVNYAEEWREKATDFSVYKLSISEVLATPALKDVKTLTWRMINGVPYYLVQKSYRTPILIDARENSEVKQKVFSREEIASIASQKFSNHTYTLDVMNEYDGYYNNPANAIAKLKFEDNNLSWLYIDTHNPDFTASLDKSSRLRRWLYHGLHTFNFPALEGVDWLRKTLLIIVSIFGTIISLTGVVLGYRYCKRKLKK